MTRKYFGTDGIRARVGSKHMNADFVLKLGWAAGRTMAAKGTKRVIIGKDTRQSGYMFESALEAGFASAGVNVLLTGPLPTPAVAYLTSAFRADAGVVISASHNPYHDNGIKFFSPSGTKLNDQEELEIERLLDHALAGGDMAPIDAGKYGRARRIDTADGRYIEYCKGTFPKHLNLHNLKIVVDSANGAAYKVANKVFGELGAWVINIGNEPNGTNINKECGATSMAAIQAKVLEEKADLGIALDGDADRIMMVDEHGQVVDGDGIVFILARYWQQKEQLEGGVVGTLMSNLGLERALAALNIPFARANVGDRYVVEQLHQRGWHLGGENSGHILSLQHSTTGDGIVAALQVLAAQVESDVSLATLAGGMEMVPQILINVRFDAEQGNPLDSDAVKALVTDIEAELGDEGRVLLRKSGTEPLIRVMVEALDADAAQSCAERIAAAL